MSQKSVHITPLVFTTGIGTVFNLATIVCLKKGNKNSAKSVFLKINIGPLKDFWGKFFF
jgi:hypothetical protein